jgi:hypothetical protein
MCSAIRHAEVSSALFKEDPETILEDNPSSGIVIARRLRRSNHLADSSVEIASADKGSASQ